MIARTLKLVSMTACSWALAGCSTPQAVLDQANNGAALSISLQTQLTALRAAQANVAQFRLDSIRRQNAMMAEYAADTAFDDRVQAVIGKTDESQLANALRMLADSRAEDEKSLEDTLAVLDKDMAAVLGPVPLADAKLQATQKALAALGEEFSPKQRVRIIAMFAADLKKAIDANQEKADATAGAPEAPIQAKQEFGSPRIKKK